MFNLIRLLHLLMILIILIINLILFIVKKKNEIITLIIKGLTINAVVIDFISSTYYDKTNETVTKYLCYAQNRLIIVTETNEIVICDKTICYYCVIPEADEILKDYINN